MGKIIYDRKKQRAERDRTEKHGATTNKAKAKLPVTWQDYNIGKGLLTTLVNIILQIN